MKKLIILATLFMVGTASPVRADYPDFTELVKKASPAVVNIRTTRSTSKRFEGLDDQKVPEMFRRFFREMPDRQKPGPSAGSGFIIESDGYILTNNHVVDGAEEIIVALSDRREREAVIVGQDALSDLAVLKIEGENLPTLDMGSSDSLEAGQWVVAIGSPFGFEHSVTAGIVSAIGRSLPENNGNYVPFIQTDVAINPGNSGGPLLDLNGKVVGINSQILTRSGGFMGLSFAIPIDVAMEVAEQLKEQGVVSRGWLGVLIQRVDRDLAESFGLDRPAGALVTQVFADSPAEEGGLHQGDIILSFNGKMIDLSSDLPHLVGRARAESVATLEIMRSAKRQKIEVTIGKLGIENIGPQSSNSPLAANGNRIGIDIVDLEDVDKRRLEVSKGVLISQVYSGPAREAGIQRGDVLTDIDGEAISSAEQLERLVAALPGDISVHIRIVRNKRPQYLALKVPVM
ncbi:MAG: DegQ family serine endoprotease [Pseudomonadales bacterium]|nr:DegQ family serine endoprotease [Pseudomonadales bacterium]